jgi:hypothetical protein
MFIFGTLEKMFQIIGGENCDLIFFSEKYLLSMEILEKNESREQIKE